LNHLTKTVGGELLENVPDFPFTGGNPLPIRCIIHGPQGPIQRSLASLGQLPLEDFLVHIRLLNKMPPTPIITPFAKKDGHTPRKPISCPALFYCSLLARMMHRRDAEIAEKKKCT
jgi:hypothetical protein